MTLKEKFYAIYKKVYKTDKEPNSFELAKLANILAIAADFYANAEQEIGTDVCNALKKMRQSKNRLCSGRCNCTNEIIKQRITLSKGVFLLRWYNYPLIARKRAKRLNFN